MRRAFQAHGLSVTTLAVVGLFVVGCGGSSKHCKRYNDKLEVYMDLKAAGNLTNTAERFARLQAIASRNSLSRADQVLIVEEVAHSALSDREKLDLMVTLIRNPSLTLDGKACMLCFIEKGKLPAGPGQELLKTFIDYPTTRDVDDIMSRPDFVCAVRTDRVISGSPLMAPAVTFPMAPAALVTPAPAAVVAPARSPVPQVRVQAVTPTPVPAAVVVTPAPAPSTPIITPIPVQ